MTDLPRCLPAPRSFAASPKRRKRLFIFVPGAREDLGSGFQWEIGSAVAESVVERMVVAKTRCVDVLFSVYYLCGFSWFVNQPPLI